MRGVVAAIAWIARQVRPDLSYGVSKLQSITTRAHVKDLTEANKLLNFALEHSDKGIHFTSKEINWDDMIVCAIIDASFANEKVVVSNEKESNRSQQGHIIVLAPADMMNRSEAVVHPVTWSSTVITRVCRSTLMAEAFVLIR